MFRYELRTADGDDAGEATVRARVAVDDCIQVDGDPNHVVRVTAVVPLERIGEFVDAPLAGILEVVDAPLHTLPLWHGGPHDHDIVIR